MIITDQYEGKWRLRLYLFLTVQQAWWIMFMRAWKLCCCKLKTAFREFAIKLRSWAVLLLSIFWGVLFVASESCTARKAVCDRGCHLPVQSISALLEMEQRSLLPHLLGNWQCPHILQTWRHRYWNFHTAPLSHVRKWHSTGLGCSKYMATTTTWQGVPLNQSWIFFPACVEDDM